MNLSISTPLKDSPHANHKRLSTVGFLAIADRLGLPLTFLSLSPTFPSVLSPRCHSRQSKLLFHLLGLSDIIRSRHFFKLWIRRLFPGLGSLIRQARGSQNLPDSFRTNRIHQAYPLYVFFQLYQRPLGIRFPQIFGST